MAKNMLKSYGRFELLELIYSMRKENLELKERCDAAENEVVEVRRQTEKSIANPAATRVGPGKFCYNSAASPFSNKGTDE